AARGRKYDEDALAHSEADERTQHDGARSSSRGRARGILTGFGRFASGKSLGRAHRRVGKAWGEGADLRRTELVADVESCLKVGTGAVQSGARINVVEIDAPPDGTKSMLIIMQK